VNETLKQIMSRVLKLTATLLSALMLTLGVFSDQAKATTFRLQEATIADINKAFDAGVLTSEQLVQLYLNRIEAYDQQGPKLNSIITINPNALQIAQELDQERKLKGPRGPLHGIPIILKDNYDTFDLPTTAGSLVLKDSIPADDAFTVKQFREAGAIILAKANMNEWAWGAAGFPGLPRNPYNLNRGPSGSSSGTGTAIAANFAVVGTGSDTGGALRGASAGTNLVGIKPTLGLTSRDGIIPISFSLDVGGPMARTVTDAAISLGAMTGVDVNDSRTLESEGKFYKDYTQFLKVEALKDARIGVARDFFTNSKVDKIVETAIAKMAELGATIVDPIHFPADVLASRGSYPNPEGVWPTLSYSEFNAQIADYLATLGNEYSKSLEDIIAISKSFEPEFPALEMTIKKLLEPAAATGGLTNSAYLDAVENKVPLIRNTILNIMNYNNLDAIVFPTIRCESPTLPSVLDPTYVCEPGTSATNLPTNLANISGFPDISVPIGFTANGLPINISLLGRAYSEPTLLGFAYAFEQATKFRRPPESTPPLPGEEFEYSSKLSK
jgi:amidase